MKTLLFMTKNNLKRINICKLDDHKNLNDYALITGKKLYSFEKDPNISISVLIEENPKLTHNIAEIIAQLGLLLFEKTILLTSTKRRNQRKEILFQNYVLFSRIFSSKRFLKSTRN